MSGQEVSCFQSSGDEHLILTPLLSDEATRGWSYEHLSSVQDATPRVRPEANPLAIRSPNDGSIAVAYQTDPGPSGSGEFLYIMKGAITEQ